VEDNEETQVLQGRDLESRTRPWQHDKTWIRVPSKIMRSAWLAILRSGKDPENGDLVDDNQSEDRESEQQEPDTSNGGRPGLGTRNRTNSQNSVTGIDELEDDSRSFHAPLRVLTSMRGERARKHIRRGFRGTKACCLFHIVPLLMSAIQNTCMTRRSRSLTGLTTRSHKVKDHSNRIELDRPILYISHLLLSPHRRGLGCTSCANLGFEPRYCW
jgi:hypothetical protein